MTTSELKEWQEKFYACLALEFSDQSYFKVHHIMVPTFLIQAGKYSRPYAERIILLLTEFLDDPNRPPAVEWIKEIHAQLSSNVRTDRLLIEGVGEVVHADQSILDVRTDTAEHYCTDVVQWSKSVLRAIETSAK